MKNQQSAKKRYSSLENSLRILKTFSMDEPELGVSDLAEKLSMGKSTTHRLLKTLSSEGFVIKDPKTRLYSLGVSVLALTNTMRSQLNILKEATPVLENLTEKTGESSHIGIVEGNEIIYLQKVECENPIRLFTHIGKRNPIHCSGTGQVILAYQNESFIEEFLSQELRSFTRHSITNSYLLKVKLRQIKEQGYAISDSELHDDIISIAAPIFNGKNDVIAAINIAGPVNRIKSTKKIYLDAVLKAGRDLSLQVISRTR